MVLSLPQTNAETWKTNSSKLNILTSYSSPINDKIKMLITITRVQSNWDIMYGWFIHPICSDSRKRRKAVFHLYIERFLKYFSFLFCSKTHSKEMLSQNSCGEWKDYSRQESKGKERRMNRNSFETPFNGMENP